MKKILRKIVAKLSAQLLLVSAVLFLTSTPIVAQPEGHDPSKTTRAGGQQILTQQLPSIRERQFRVLEMERESAKARTPEEEQLALQQIAQDYERIQVINNKMMSTNMSAPALNYANISSTTSEIRKRAMRMKENLRLPIATPDEAEKKAEYQRSEDAASLKAALLKLDGSIMSFVKSPIFKTPGVVNLEQADKARRDLETIIAFSQVINKDAQRLEDTKAKP